MGAAASADEQMIYDMTKAMWENMEEFYSVAPVLRAVTKETVFSQMLAPLHAGAYRYYKEAGFDIPANLIRCKITLCSCPAVGPGTDKYITSLRWFLLHLRGW